AMLAEIQPRNKFYAPRLAAAETDSLSTFFESTPFTTKQELVDDQLSCPPFGTNLTYDIGRYTRYNQTSGTSGRPLRWLDTPESWEWMTGNWQEVFQASGVEPGARIFFAFSFGP